MQKAGKRSACVSHNSQITVCGFSMGAHIAAFFCRAIRAAKHALTNEDLIAMLFGKNKLNFIRYVNFINLKSDHNLKMTLNRL